MMFAGTINDTGTQEWVVSVSIRPANKATAEPEHPVSIIVCAPDSRLAVIAVLAQVILDDGEQITNVNVNVAQAIQMTWKAPFVSKTTQELTKG